MVIHTGASFNLISNQLLVDVAGRTTEGGPSFWGPVLRTKIQMESLISPFTAAQVGFCNHLENEWEDGKSLSLSNSEFQIKRTENWKSWLNENALIYIQSYLHRIRYFICIMECKEILLNKIAVGSEVNFALFCTFYMICRLLLISTYVYVIVQSSFHWKCINQEGWVLLWNEVTKVTSQPSAPAWYTP